MWIVVVVDYHYPSVFHFDNEVEARKSFNKERFMGHIVHLAKVTNSKINEDKCDFIDGESVETLDVEWYTER